MTSYAKHPTRGRLAFRWLGSRAAVPTLVIGPQLVPIMVVSSLTGSAAIAIVPGVVLTATFFASLTGPRIRPRSRAHLYVGLWPFFAWWSGCLALTFLAPLALLAGAVSGGAAETWLGVATAAAAVTAVAAIRRTPRITPVRLRYPDLPAGFDGYRIVQISDVHCGPFAPETRVRDWVRRANALRPDLIAVTGDLITSGTDYVDAVAAALGELRAPDGVVACMGNHDYFGAGEALVDALRARGIDILRNEHRVVRRGGDELVVAGIDDTWTQRDDLDGAIEGRPAGTFTVLLAHDPDVFPNAAARDIQLTLSGHTHGGQIAVPLAARRFNLARIAHAYSSGRYREHSSQLYVNRGVGTSGPPVRIGTRGEIAIISLHRDASGPPARHADE